MAVWNEKYYKGSDVYSDGSIEDEILEIVCRDDYKEKRDELIGNNYTIAYHLTPVRENILSWYPFTKEQSAIEIGAGCGAITGMLCRKLGKVVSVDLSKRRSKINYERHKDCDNLEIIIGNFNDMELEEQYDYVVLNGVFEYAISFTDSERPYHDFLRHISRFLKPDGKFLISIENKLGLKYFNGGKEDHTGNYFLGLNDYPENDSVRTFSKTELEEILADEGFVYTKFYYPYPDYKFPNEVFTEETMGTNQYGRPTINIEDARYSLFNEQTVGKTLIKEQVRHIFANSFMVEASKEQFESEVLYAKLNVERKPEFQIGTSIINKAGTKSVEKYALHPMAEKHIKTIYKTASTKGTQVEYLSAEQKGDAISFGFLETQNLDGEINGLIAKKDADAIYQIMDGFYGAYLKEFSEVKKTSAYRTEKFCEFFGTATSEKEFLCVKNANIDVIMDNVYVVDGTYTLIDGEWIYPEWIPYQFVVWRSVNEAYSKHKDLDAVISRKEMMKHLQITEADESMFFAWATYFAENYVGSSFRQQWMKPVKHISLDEIHRENSILDKLLMFLYVDSGAGFSEAEKLLAYATVKNGEFEVQFELSNGNNIKMLRFDPVEGYICKVKINSISEGAMMLHNNAVDKMAGEWMFTNLDPQFYMQVNNKLSTLCIKGTIDIFNKQRTAQYLQQLLEQFDVSENENGVARFKRKSIVKKSFKNAKKLLKKIKRKLSN